MEEGSIGKLIKKYAGQVLSAEDVARNNKLESSFEKHAKRFNDRLSRTHCFEEFKHLPGLRWLCGKSWPNRFAYGCGLCFDFVCSEAFTELAKVNACLRTCKKNFALLALTSDIANSQVCTAASFYRTAGSASASASI